MIANLYRICDWLLNLISFLSCLMLAADGLTLTLEYCYTATTIIYCILKHSFLNIYIYLFQQLPKKTGSFVILFGIFVCTRQILFYFVIEYILFIKSIPFKFKFYTHILRFYTMPLQRLLLLLLL